MNSMITWTEIPVEDLDRAKTFYHQVFGLSYLEMKLAEYHYALLQRPDEERSTFALVKGYGFKPSLNGITIYLNAGPDLDEYLKRASQSGGSIIMDKTYLSKEAGFIAYIQDSEGNKIGLQHF